MQTELDVDPAEIVRVVDCETTGRPEDFQRELCQLGWIDLNLRTMQLQNPTQFFVNPCHDIPPATRGVHHISNQMVKGAIVPDAARARLLEGLGPHDVLAAHNAKFEQFFLPAPGHRWICTMKCAMRAFPDYQSHGNQAVRYELDIDEEPGFDPRRAEPPHWALPDSYVTAHILRRLLKQRTIPRLVEISLEPPITRFIKFGKHKGEKWADLPADYLSWMINKSEMDEETKDAAKWWLNKRTARA